jgi:hypothetical protein
VTPSESPVKGSLEGSPGDRHLQRQRHSHQLLVRHSAGLNSARRRLCPNPRGYIPLRAYGWSLTTWVVKVTLDHPQSEPQVGQQPDIAGPADAAQSEPHSACDGQPPTQRGRNRVEAITQPYETAKLPRATRELANAVCPSADEARDVSN